MRVLIIASWYPGAKNPVRASFIREQAVALAKRGLDVHVAYFDRDRASLPFSLRSSRSGELTEHAIGLQWPLHRLVGFYAPSAAAMVLRRLIARLSPDIVHAHAARPAAVVAGLALANCSVPFFVTEHRGNLSGYWQTEHGRRQIATAYDRADQLIAVSESLKATISEHFPRAGARCLVRPNGIDGERFRMKAGRRHVGGQHEKRVLFLGGVPENKGLAVLLDALASLSDAFRLSVAGPGATREAVSSLARRAGVEERVEALGLVGRDEVVQLLNAHDVLAMPSRYETFGLAAAEALACGTAVVATRCGGLEEFVCEPFGRLIDLDDPGALATALQEITCRANYPSEEARAYIIRNFSLDAAAARLETDYREAVAGTRA